MSSCSVLGVERREGVEGDHVVLDWLVDGESFGELVRKRNGWAHRGPFMSFLEHGSRADYLLGRLGALDADKRPHRASVLVCPECHDPACNQITVGVRMAGNQVVWHQIAQDNGDYSELDDVFDPTWQIQFDLTQYTAVLSEIRHTIRTHRLGGRDKLDLSSWPNGS